MQMSADQVFHSDEAWPLGLAREPDEARHLSGQRKQRRHPTAVGGSTERKPETHPPVRDEGEGVRRVDRERRQDRKNSMGEVIV